jgi:ATP-dependent Clp protease ATP-binding subunit ClpA
MFPPFNDAVYLLLRVADLEAKRLHRNCIDTEHLLLALAELRDCVAAEVLAKARIRLIEVHQAVEKAVLCEGNISFLTRPQLAVHQAVEKAARSEPDASSEDREHSTPGALKAMVLACDAAERLGHAQVGTGHVLLGLLEEAEGVAFRVLCQLGIGIVGNNLSRVAERISEEMSRR